MIVITGKNVLKRKGFCPNPVALDGIPEFADSVTFPEVWGTPDWLSWWEQQISYCMLGYETGGLWIPGRYYYYLNFAYMFTVGRGFHHPDYVDTDYDFFLLVEFCKKNNRGIISIKARRRGLSFKTNKGVIEYGSKFLGPKYTGGICAGVKSYAEDFYIKLIDTEAVTAPELSTHNLKSNEEKRIYGYEEKDFTGKFVTSGTLNEVYVRTAFQSGNIFKGTQLDDCIFEESGEFKNLLATYGATKWCFMDGEQMIGTPYIYGTGGNMNSSSRDFSEMWSNADLMKLERFWIPGSKIYKPCFVGCTNTQGDIINQIPNIEVQYKGKDPSQIIGMEDYNEATRQILLERDRLKKIQNKKALREHLQNNPLTIEEAFLSSADNNYDTEILHTRTLELMGMDQLHLDVVMDFVRNKDGQLVYPLEVNIRMANTEEGSLNKDPEWKVIKMYQWPAKNYRNLDALGIDGYDQDESNTSKSLGGGLIYRERHLDFKIYGPIATYYKRPPRKEQFFHIMMCMSVAYCSPHFTLADAGSPMVIDYFINNGCENQLAFRPTAFESPNSEQKHTYGLKFTPFNRTTLESLVQTEILDNGHTWFDPELCKDCSSYNTGDNDNDADLHDALILAKAKHKDSNVPIRHIDKLKEKSKPIMRRSPEGYIYYENQNASTKQYQGDLFLNLISSGAFKTKS